MTDKMESAYLKIKNNIINNTYKPSQRLIESQLSEEIGVSRNTIRQILLKLEREKLVVIEKNKGAYIKVLDLEEVLNILEIRELLEALIAKSAVDHITTDQLDRLNEILSEMEQSIQEERYDDYSKGNRKFHDVIYKASKKPEAVELVKTFKTQLVRHQFRTVLVAGRNFNSFNEHTNIYNALKNGDKKAVEEAIRIHISNVAKTIKDYYQFLI
ncbi:GntR family transcriptional regulator [Virgibacillus ndiopensis]|uniref:GntR family transcriptional regulator n=1 Tax=Virgibacillus ndiopensis TaxID=2004408 RepID=UPI000C08B45B|nr:GntR family transcriptional regulator [Virgibacillus ndiopensis]